MLKSQIEYLLKYRKHMIVDLSFDEIETCRTFARDLMPTLGYLEERESTSLSKQQTDAFIGKLAEFATYRLLSAKGNKCTKPDVSIHRSKHWGPDLKFGVGDAPIHVKSQQKTSSQRLGNQISWTFQTSGFYSNRGHRDDLVSSPTGFLFLWMVEQKGENLYTAYLCAARPAKELIPAFLRDPLRSSNKKCIYFKDLVPIQ